jgi:molybdopterin converting factor small subunit
MVAVHVTIPSMLAALVGGERRFTVEADAVGHAVTALFERHPELRVHLLDEQGSLRPHVSLFHNEVAIRAPTGTVAAGDTLTILQAVSGGAPGCAERRR